MNNTTLVATLVEVGWALRYVAYFDVASLTFVVAEIWHSLPDEVSLVWHSKWSMGKTLFLLSRYLGFFDISVAIYYTSAANGVKLCERLFAAGSTLQVVGVALAETILYLRVFALSAKSFRLGVLLAILFVGFHTATLVFLTKFIQSLEYVKSPAPTIIGCFPVKMSTKDLSIITALVMSSEVVILAMTIWLVLAKFKRSKSRLVTLMYRDGLVYFVLLTAISAGNMICYFVAPPGYSFLLITPQRALHSILATRMVLHLRKMYGPSVDETPGGIPLSEIVCAVPAHVYTDPESVQTLKKPYMEIVAWPDREQHVPRSE
ncbi:hypothetical protein FA13DRAFT_365468 [Coprinellus micaceus]|uniref:DUF6533 domain-containing protein n=1 Tax=Coprinellus micaceus TaxID=71717 RepID=A0A4Y7TCW0_COPMI|nr:hypothetical protein FA13DRAFT_365468 [Coprinellus micaceus]